MNTVNKTKYFFTVGEGFSQNLKSALQNVLETHYIFRSILVGPRMQGDVELHKVSCESEMIWLL